MQLDPLELARLQGVACGAADMADSLRDLCKRPIPKYARTELESCAKRLDFAWAAIHKAVEKLEK